MLTVHINEILLDKKNKRTRKQTVYSNNEEKKVTIT